MSLALLSAIDSAQAQTAADATAARDPDARAYLARLDAAPSATFVVALDRFVSRGKTSGWWANTMAVYVLCAPSEKAATLNLRGGGLDLAVVGKVVLSPYTGISSDRQTGYLESGLPPARIPGFEPQRHSLFVFSQTDAPSLAGEIGASGGGTNLGVRVRNAVHATSWSGSRVPIWHEVKTGVGLSGFVRTGPAGGFTVRNEETLPFFQDAKSLPTGPMRILCSGGPNLLSRNQVAFAFVGNGSITAAQTAELYRSCIEMLDTLGKRIPDVRPLPAEPPHAFDRRSIDRVTPRGLEVFRIAAPPPADDTDYAKDYRFAPLNNAVQRPWGEAAASTDSKVARWELIWSDRALGPREGVVSAWARKGNDTMGRIFNTKKEQCRTEFDSYEKAIGSTLVKTAYTAGLAFRRDKDHPDGKGWGDIAEEWGYDVSVWDAVWRRNPSDPLFSKDVPVDTGAIVHRAYCSDPANVDAFFHRNAVDGVFRTVRDRVILGQGRLCDQRMARGFVIDHEHADDRPPELQLRFIVEIAKIAHCKGFKIGATGHPPNHGAGMHGGWTRENAQIILNRLDWHTIVSPSETPKEGQRAFLQSQIDYFTDPRTGQPPSPDKLCVQIQIGGAGQEMSVQDARDIRAFMIEKKIPRCFPSNAYAAPGGPLSRPPNQVIAAFLGLPME